MAFISPQPCTSQVDGSGECCPNTFIGFCLMDGTPIAIVIQGGLQIGWTNLLTGVFTAGPPPAGTQICDTGGGGPLDCATDSVTICSNYEYPEDSPHISGDVGAFVLAVRNDGGLALAANGDYIPFTTDSTGALRVTGSSVTINFEYPEDSPHVSGDIGAFVLAVRNDAGIALAADGDYIPFTTDATGALRVTGSAVTINFEYPEDSPHVSGDIGAFTLAVRNDAGTPLAGNGDYIPYTTDAQGDLRVVASNNPTIDSTIVRQTGIGTVTILAGARSVAYTGLGGGARTLSIGGGPVVTLPNNITLSWSVDQGGNNGESLADSFVFDATAASADFIITTTREI